MLRVREYVEVISIFGMLYVISSIVLTSQARTSHKTVIKHYSKTFNSYTRVSPDCNCNANTIQTGLHRPHDRRRHPRPRPRISRYSPRRPPFSQTPLPRRPRSHRTKHHLRPMRALLDRPLQWLRISPIPVHTTRHRSPATIPQTPSDVVPQAPRQPNLRRRRNVRAPQRRTGRNGSRKHPSR